MNDIRIAVEMAFRSTPHGTDEQFEQFLDAVQDQLDALGREVQLATRLTERVADFATSIDEPRGFEIAAAGFLVDLRTALHAVGCVTAAWPHFEATQRTVRELQDV